MKVRTTCRRQQGHNRLSQLVQEVFVFDLIGVVQDLELVDTSEHLRGVLTYPFDVVGPMEITTA